MLRQGCACGVVRFRHKESVRAACSHSLAMHHIRQPGQWPNTSKFHAAVNILALVHTNTLYECIHCISQELNVAQVYALKFITFIKHFLPVYLIYFSIIFILFYSIFLLEHSYPRVTVFATVCTLFVVLCCFVKLNFPYGGSIKIHLI